MAIRIDRDTIVIDAVLEGQRILRELLPFKLIEQWYAISLAVIADYPECDRDTCHS